MEEKTQEEISSPLLDEEIAPPKEVPGGYQFSEDFFAEAEEPATAEAPEGQTAAAPERTIPEEDPEAFKEADFEGTPVEEVKAAIPSAFSEMTYKYFEQYFPMLFGLFCKMNPAKYEHLENDGIIPDTLRVSESIHERNEQIESSFELNDFEQREISESWRELLDKHNVNMDVGPEGRLLMALVSVSVRNMKTVSKIKRENKRYLSELDSRIKKFHLKSTANEKVD